MRWRVYLIAVALGAAAIGSGLLVHVATARRGAPVLTRYRVLGWTADGRGVWVESVPIYRTRAGFEAGPSAPQAIACDPSDPPSPDVLAAGPPAGSRGGPELPPWPWLAPHRRIFREGAPLAAIAPGPEAPDLVGLGGEPGGWYGRAVLYFPSPRGDRVAFTVRGFDVYVISRTGRVPVGIAPGGARTFDLARMRGALQPEALVHTLRCLQLMEPAYIADRAQDVLLAGLTHRERRVWSAAVVAAAPENGDPVASPRVAEALAWLLAPVVARPPTTLDPEAAVRFPLTPEEIAHATPGAGDLSPDSARRIAAALASVLAALPLDAGSSLERTAEALRGVPVLLYGRLPERDDLMVRIVRELARRGVPFDCDPTVDWLVHARALDRTERSLLDFLADTGERAALIEVAARAERAVITGAARARLRGTR